MSRSTRRIALLGLGLLLALSAAAPRRALALPFLLCTQCDCEIAAFEDIDKFYGEEIGITTAHLAIEITSTEAWLVYIFHAYTLPMLQGMAEQATTTAMMQTFIFGTFLDARQQLDVQRTLEELTARAHKDYQTSVDLCMFGTVTRSLGASMFRSEANAVAMNAFGEQRSSGSAGTEASQGPLSDRLSRLQQLRSRYCTGSDNGGNLTELCTENNGDVDTEDRDIDYSGVMERTPTLEADAINTANKTEPTNDEQDLWGLASNLYGHDVPWRVPEWTFNQPAAQQSMLDIRSINAQRAVAQASFYTIAGLKSQGTPDDNNNFSSGDVAGYMNVILKQLGVPIDPNNQNDSTAALVLGDRPSYDAQMEVLTKRIFQDARFYTNLYDTPANVERKRVAMQAIGLIQDFDTLQSNLRTEMILSQTLELDLIKLQKRVVNEVTNITAEATHL